MSLLRTCGLRALKFFGRDISITHQWIPEQKIRLHAYKHKGYWWHGRNREKATMLAASQLIHPGDTIIEVGGHIGYLTNWFAKLTGATGSVLVFEPSYDNLRYLERNIAKWPWVKIDRRGISDFEGTATFYIEALTGQNNSLLADYDVFEKNASAAGVSSQREEEKIEVTTIDKVCEANGLSPDFIKIDIEGAELSALKGMQAVFCESRPIILIELTVDTQVCFDLLKRNGYIAFTEKLKRVFPSHINSENKEQHISWNFIFIHSESNRLPLSDV
jgi:FkbM family methyltransferase